MFISRIKKKKKRDRSFGRREEIFWRKRKRNQPTNINMTTYDENMLDYHEEDIDPDFALALCILGLIAAAFSLCIPLCIVSRRNKRVEESKAIIKEEETYDCMIAFMCFWSVCFLTAMVLLLCYANRLRIRDDQDYRGNMRITGLAEYRERKETRNKRPYHYYDAVLQLDWGYEWACPSHGAPACTTSTVKVCETLICERGRCRSSEKNRARAKAEACVLANFGNITTLEELQEFYTPYDPTVGPSQDVDWPHLVAYGDCNTCDASLTVPTRGNLRNLRKSGLAFLGATGGGWLLTALFVTWMWIRHGRGKRNGGNNEDDEEENHEDEDGSDAPSNVDVEDATMVESTSDIFYESKGNDNHNKEEEETTEESDDAPTVQTCYFSARQD